MSTNRIMLASILAVASTDCAPTTTAAVAPLRDEAVAEAARPACPDDMVWFAGASFTMGRPLDPNGFGVPSPPHLVRLAPFCLARTEVRVSDYDACIRAGACGARGRDFLECNPSDAEHASHPANCVTWMNASAYCRWRGGRLPTEAEWERAARGIEGRLYPWGDTPPTSERLNVAFGERAPTSLQRRIGAEARDDSDGFVNTAPVGSFPTGATPEGLLDMAGNVMEWVEDWDGPLGEEPVVDPHGPADGKYRVYRGSSYFTPASLTFDLAAAWRQRVEPSTEDPTIGFRCAASSPHAGARG